MNHSATAPAAAQTTDDHAISGGSARSYQASFLRAVERALQFQAITQARWVGCILCVAVQGLVGDYGTAFLIVAIGNQIAEPVLEVAGSTVVPTGLGTLRHGRRPSKSSSLNCKGAESGTSPLAPLPT
jgi:hypothetical protein